MSENPQIAVRLSPTQQKDLNALHEIHKLVTGDETLTKSHTIRGIFSMTLKYLNNPDPDKKTPLDVWVEFLREESLKQEQALEA